MYNLQIVSIRKERKGKKKRKVGKGCIYFYFYLLPLIILTVRGKAGGDPTSEVSVILTRGIEVAGISFWNVVAPSQGTAPVTKKEARVGAVERIVGEICLAIVSPVVSLSTGIVESVQTAAAATVLVSTWRMRVHSKCEMRCTRVFVVSVGVANALETQLKIPHEN